VFVMASIEEGLAMVQVQALACGLPLICTTNTGGEDLLGLAGASPHHGNRGIEEYPAGYVVPIRDPEAIAGLLWELAANPHLLWQKRCAALALREQRMGWDTFAERTVAVYQSLIATRSSSPVLLGVST